MANGPGAGFACGWDLALWTRSSLVVRASNCQWRSRKSPRFDPGILRHSGIWGAADEAVLNTVRREKKSKKIPSVVNYSCVFSSGVCARQEQGRGQQLLQPRNSGPGPPSLPRPHLLQLPLSRLIQVPYGTLHTFVLIFSVVDPWHFVTDPDPRICASDQWIRIQLRILLFMSLTFNTP